MQKKVYNLEPVSTGDGSYTLFSNQFKQHYHSVKEGALNESLYKHVIPAFEYHKNKDQLYILDICFGLGYNTLATLYYLKINNISKKVYIYSPEFDKQLIKSLKNFSYPKEFEQFKYIIDILANDFYYSDDQISIELFIGDARDYIVKLKDKVKFDIVYQDAFSSDQNPRLWSVEYFNDIGQICGDDAVITTYSIATPIRLSIYINGFNIYEYKPENTNRITIALKNSDIAKNQRYKYIDMELKKQRNKEAKPLFDKKD